MCPGSRHTLAERRPANRDGAKPRRLPVVATVLLLTCHGVAEAQVNIEALRRDSLAAGLSGSVGLDLAFRSGNVELLELALTGRVDYAREPWSGFVVGNGEVGLQGGARFDNSGLAHLRASRTLVGRIASEAFAQVNYEEPRLLQFRSLGGVGMRARLVQGSTARLTAGTGYMLEYERLDLSPDASHPATTLAHRWSNYVSLLARSTDRLALVMTLYAQPRFDAPSDIRLRQDLGLAVGITRTVAVSVTLNVRYDSRPPDEIEPHDVSLRTGVTASFP